MGIGIQRPRTENSAENVWCLESDGNGGNLPSSKEKGMSHPRKKVKDLVRFRTRLVSDMLQSTTKKRESALRQMEDIV